MHIVEFGGSGPPLHFAHANGYPPGSYRRMLEPLTATHDARLSSVSDQMVRARIGAIPVLEGPALVGILCLSDVLRCWLKALQQS